jgi:hypothetical protein
VCCIRVPGAGRRGKRLQEVATYQTMTRSLLVLADRLAELGAGSGRPGESHPRAPMERSVTVSCHSAGASLIIKGA